MLGPYRCFAAAFVAALLVLTAAFPFLLMLRVMGVLAGSAFLASMVMLGANGSGCRYG